MKIYMKNVCNKYVNNLVAKYAFNTLTRSKTHRTQHSQGGGRGGASPHKL